MTSTELVGLLLFLVVVAGVFTVAGLTALAALAARRRWLPDLPPGLGRLARLSWALAALGVGCIAYGHFVEPYWVEVQEHRLETPKLERGQRLRLVHLSDIHSDPQARLEPELPGRIAALSPDLIVFTGDSINSEDGLPVFRDLLRRLAAIAPTYVVRGNWDMWFWGNLELFDGTGARELVDEVVEVRAKDAVVRLGGLRADSSKRDAVLAALRGPALSVFLHHYPDEADAAAAAGVDLYCAGHTHGGQVALPFYGALVTFSRFGKRFEAGAYEVGAMRLYVSRGIGMEGGAAPRVRFFARPEISVHDVIGTGQTAVAE